MDSLTWLPPASSRSEFDLLSRTAARAGILGPQDHGKEFHTLRHLQVALWAHLWTYLRGGLLTFLNNSPKVHLLIHTFSPLMEVQQRCWVPRVCLCPVYTRVRARVCVCVSTCKNKWYFSGSPTTLEEPTSGFLQSSARMLPISRKPHQAWLIDLNVKAHPLGISKGLSEKSCKHS